MSKKITTALLMAAGMGTRIRPISETTPKPLIPVNGEPIIETNIKTLMSRGIEEIFITVGYKKEKYEYLTEKYKNIILIENTEYKIKNTISSFYAAKDFIKGKNCIVSESDLYIADPNIVPSSVERSSYLLRFVAPQDYEWGFQLKDERIKKVVRPIKETFLNHHMYGFAFWLKDDLNLLIGEVEKQYNDERVYQMAYDEIANELFDDIDMGYIAVPDNTIYEIDCLEDLVKIDPSYKKYL